MDSLKEISFDVEKKDYHKSVMCGVCGKWMRDDHINRHSKTHLNKREKQSNKVKNEELPTTYTSADLEQELLRYNDIYLERFNRGKQIYDILCKGTVVEDALPNHHKQALDIYLKSKTPMDLTHIKLRPWQQELSEKINTPTEREIIWVKGVKGNERQDLVPVGRQINPSRNLCFVCPRELFTCQSEAKFVHHQELCCEHSVIRSFTVRQLRVFLMHHPANKRNILHIVYKLYSLYKIHLTRGNS